MIDTSRLLAVIVESGLFIAALAAVAASFMIAAIRKKFKNRVVASVFRTVSIGLLFIAGGIILDAVNSYFQISDALAVIGILLGKEIFFLIGTYIIVIGMKKTGDKLASLTK